MISVITPVYNGENFIASCIQNVIDQNCTNVEHIIIDGGSNDNTVKIIQYYAQRYSHIQWISEKDRGQSDAMNKGIAIAHGKIISFLNVDDYYEPNTLNQILEIFKASPEPSFVVGNCQIWDDDNRVIDINKPAKMRLLDLVLGLYVNPFPCNPAAYFYHRSLHDQVGYYAIEDHYAMDLDFILRAVQVAHVKYVDQIWGNHRRIDGTKTFTDMASGNAEKRIRRLFRKYRRNLTFRERLYLIAWKIGSAIAFLAHLPKRAIRKLLVH